MCPIPIIYFFIMRSVILISLISLVPSCLAQNDIVSIFKTLLDRCNSSYPVHIRREDEFQLENKLGQGSFGTVWKGYLKSSKGSVRKAIKQIDVDETSVFQVADEVCALQKLRDIHNVIQMEGITIQKAARGFRVGLILDLYDNELQTCIFYFQAGNPSSECVKRVMGNKIANSTRNIMKKMAQRIFGKKSMLSSPEYLQWSRAIMKQIAIGIKATHTQGIAHLDLKPSNILVSFSTESSQPVAYVSDYGLARHLILNDTSAKSDGSVLPPFLKTSPPRHFKLAPQERDDHRWGFVGTYAYMAPDLLSGIKARVNSFGGAKRVLADPILANEIVNTQYGDSPSFAADIYSLGATFYEIATGKRAFQYTPALGEPQEARVISIATRSHSDLPHFPSKMDPNLKDLITRMLELDPEKRIDINGVLNHAYFSEKE